MIKAVVFDLDHTLFDRHGTLRRLVPSLREEFSVNKNLSDENIGAVWCNADDNFVYSGWEYILKELCDKEVFTEAPTFDAYSKFIYKHFRKTAVPFPETVPVLKELQSLGYKTGLITNGFHCLQYAKLKLLGLSDCFNEIIVTGDYGIHKPDREIFDIMRKKMGFSPEEMIYVGDNPVNDIQGARDAGWNTVWMNSTGYWDNSIRRADREIKSVNEILNAIKDPEE